MKYRLIVFDLDGTLLDTTDGILRSVEYTIRYFDLPPLPIQNLLSFIGPPIQESFAKFYGLSGPILQDIAGVFRDNYSTNNLLFATPYEGIYQLMNQLSAIGVQTAVATYKREDYALTLLKHFGFGAYTNIMYGGDHENILKKKDIILKCIDSAKISDSDSVLMVGDTEHDAVGASELGLDFLAVTYGFGFKPQKNYDIDCIGYADTPLEIFNFIQ